jgi:hypothetical protein
MRKYDRRKKTHLAMGWKTAMKKEIGRARPMIEIGGTGREKKGNNPERNVGGPASRQLLRGRKRTR